MLMRENFTRLTRQPAKRLKVTLTPLDTVALLLDTVVPFEHSRILLGPMMVEFENAGSQGIKL